MHCSNPDIYMGRGNTYIYIGDLSERNDIASEEYE